MTDEHRADDALPTINPLLLLEDLAIVVTEAARHEAHIGVGNVETDRPLGQAARSKRPFRRLSDLILIAAHEACDLARPEMAFALLMNAEATINQTEPASSGVRDHAIRKLVAAHHRIWHLRHDRELLFQDPFAAAQ